MSREEHEKKRIRSLKNIMNVSDQEIRGAQYAIPNQSDTLYRGDLIRLIHISSRKFWEYFILGAHAKLSNMPNLPPWGFHLMDPDKFEAPKEASQSPEQAPPSPYYVPSLEHPPSLDYVPIPDYPEYLVPSDDEIPVEDQPLPADALPTAPSSGYVADSDPKEDPEEDLVDYPDEEEEEHLASADSTQPAIYSVPSAEDSEPFETDESAATPPSPQTIVPLRAASPLPVPSPPLLLPSTNRRSDMIETDMSFWKRLCLTSLASRVDYEFIDTIDASIWASECRVMTAIEDVNERVIDFATTQRQDAHEL
ncbi:hypothetical protein Tco_0909852 [Tanacetum coccineum]|uniref:Uncharacterized protein n=1 Tax=Tanacetum coccineum TaxID=301880 RepID=A0ABQ5CSW9_9ASTR